MTTLLITLLLTLSPPRQANLIVIESEKAGFELFQSVVMQLMEDGYSFDNMDKDFLFLTTTPIKPNRTALEYKLDVRVMKNKVQIRSFVRVLDSFSSQTSLLRHEKENVFERGAVRSLKTSIWRYAWDRSMELAEKIPGETEYVIEK